MNDSGLVSLNSIEETKNIISEIRLGVDEQLLTHGNSGLGLGNMILGFISNLF